MSIKKIAVLSMLAVLLVAFNTPASAQFVGSAGISAASFSSFSASSLGLGFGGFGFPFNVGFVPFGMGAFPFNWRLGGGFGPFPLLGFGGFGSCFSGCGIPAIGAGLGGLAPGIAKASIAQALPFITGSPLGGSPVLGWQVAPWALGTQGCINNLPLYFGAHGFGFPFSLGAWRLSFTPSCGPCGIPACGPILGGYAPFGAGFGLPAAGAAIAK